MRGAVQLAFIVIGALLGVAVGFTIATMAKIVSEYDAYSEGFHMLALPYKARLLTIYLNETREIIENKSIEEFLKHGGPGYCGYITYDGKTIAVWENGVKECSYKKMSEKEKKVYEEKAWDSALTLASINILKKGANAMGCDAHVNSSKLFVGWNSKSMSGTVVIDISEFKLKEKILKAIEETINEKNKVYEGCVESEEGRYKEIVYEKNNITVARIEPC